MVEWSIKHWLIVGNPWNNKRHASRSMRPATDMSADQTVSAGNAEWKQRVDWPYQKTNLAFSSTVIAMVAYRYWTVQEYKAILSCAKAAITVYSLLLSILRDIACEMMFGTKDCSSLQCTALRFPVAPWPCKRKLNDERQKQNFSLIISTLFRCREATKIFSTSSIYAGAGCIVKKC